MIFEVRTPKGGAVIVEVSCKRHGGIMTDEQISQVIAAIDRLTAAVREQTRRMPHAPPAMFSGPDGNYLSGGGGGGEVAGHGSLPGGGGGGEARLAFGAGHGSSHQRDR